MNRSLVFCAAIAIAVTATPLFADFSYDESTQMTGGSMLPMMRMAGAFSKNSRKITEPVLSTTSIQGNRMVRKDADASTIIDLDKQTITTINFPKKSYSVVTFEQLKQQMAAMSEKMHSKNASQTTPSFDVKIEDTGKTKNVNGNNTHQMKMTMTMTGKDEKSGAQGGMDVVSEMWIAPDVAGYGEARDFQRRMSQSLGFVPGQNPMLSRPDMANAMTELYKQGSKLDGMPLATTIRMGVNLQGLQTASGQPPSNPDTQTAAPPPASPAEALAGALGRFGMGRRKKTNDSSPETANSSDSAACLMEMTTEVKSYNSAPVDSAMFQVPSGFKEVDQDFTNARKHQ
ncbi:MAG: DUF4412 domain-containing protein [Acidobacteriota bacterium]|nr:DUF4412 domain-containing protein [Acidobacteriota bacterium]